MRTARQKTVTALAIAAALAVTPLLAGCGGIEGVIGQVTGGAIQPSVGELPAGWPGEVPVIEGEIVGGNKATDPENDEGTLWTAIVSSSGDVDSAKSAVTDSLTGAGFTAVDTAGAPVDALPFENETYIVLVFVAAADDEKVTATYNVTERTE